MARIKPIIQKDFKDCGVCSMAYIISYYGGYIPIEKLREDTFTSSLGTTAYHIVMAFNKWGFDSYGVLEKNLFSSELSYPLIAHLRLNNNVEHFVVVLSVKKNIAYLMDPSYGYKKMKISDFELLFTGNIILVKPRHKIVKLEKGLTINELFLNIFFKEKFLIFKIIIISCLLTFFSILLSYYLKIGSNILNESYNLIKYLILLFCILTILKVFINYMREYYLNHLNNLIDLELYPDFLSHLFNLPLNNIKSRTSGEIMLRIQELSHIKNMFSDLFVSVFLDLTLVLISTIILYFINKDLFIILIIFIIVYILYGLLISKLIYKKSLKNINYETNFNSVVLENIAMFESIKNLNIKDKILQKIERSLAGLLYNNYKFNNFYNLTNIVKDYLIEICLFIINSYGFIKVYKGELNIIDLFTFNMLISYFITPIKNVINALPRYNFIKASFSKISEFINIEEEDKKKNNIILKGNIEFKNVSFSYNNYDYIIKDLNLIIKEGEHLFLDGKSGIGKSTICKLICKEYLINKGEILIDNNNIKDLYLMDIRNNIINISQNELLFNGTIKENILAYSSYDAELFKKVCEICLINDIVLKKDMRYNSLIEVDHTNISGGEAQRIVLARGLYNGLLKKSNIFIIDEGLSEVDKNMETVILKNLLKILKGKTFIYISHKKECKLFKNEFVLGENNA